MDDTHQVGLRLIPHRMHLKRVHGYAVGRDYVLEVLDGVNGEGTLGTLDVEEVLRVVRTVRRCRR